MKTVLIALFLFASAVAKGQTPTFLPVSSFLGVAFGASPDDAVQHMTAQNAIYNAPRSKKGMSIFTNAVYAGIKAEQAYFKFSEGKLFEGGAYFVADRNRVVELYHNVIRQVANAYGEGIEKRTNPMTDALELDAIEAGTGSAVTTWTEDPQQNKFNTINVSIEPDLSVLLRFTEVKTAGKKKK